MTRGDVVVRAWRNVCAVMIGAVAFLGCDDNSQSPPTQAPGVFHLEEATIGDIHAAIQGKQTTCQALVKVYLARVAAYNGPCTRLVTADGAPIPAASGYVRAGLPIKFPTDTVPVAGLLPDLDQYAGLPLDLGRMDPSVTDPAVVQQMGVLTGTPHAGQVNALET